MHYLVLWIATRKLVSGTIGQNAYVKQCNAREYLRLQIHNRASYVSFADVLTVS